MIKFTKKTSNDFQQMSFVAKAVSKDPGKPTATVYTFTPRCQSLSCR